MQVLLVIGLLLAGLGLWNVRRPGGRARYAAMGFMLGGLIIVVVALLAMAGLIRE